MYTPTLSFDIPDINECATAKGGCDHDCVNMDGSYRCVCHTGYTLSSDGKTCSGNFTAIILYIQSTTQFTNLTSFRQAYCSFSAVLHLLLWEHLVLVQYYTLKYMIQ